MATTSGRPWTRPSSPITYTERTVESSPSPAFNQLWRDESVPEDHENAWFWSAAIITTDATDDIGRIHDRTPMVITPDSWTDWLDPTNNDKELLLATMQPATSSGAGGLTSYPVSTAVNSVRNNGPALVEPLGDAGSLAGGPGSGNDRERPPEF